MAAWVQVASVETPDSSVCVVVGTVHGRIKKMAWRCTRLARVCRVSSVPTYAAGALVHAGSPLLPRQCWSRFLFNIGEGTQRLCMEHKIRLAKAEHAFFTRLSTDTLGGVPGMILTLSDIKNTGVKAEGEGGAGGKGDKRAKEGKTGAAMTLHGPPGLSEFYHATRHFMQRSDFPIAFDAVKTDATFRTEDMTVFQVPIVRARPPSKQGNEPENVSHDLDHGKGLASEATVAGLPLGSRKRPREADGVPDEEEGEETSSAHHGAAFGEGSGNGSPPREETLAGGGEGEVGCVCYVCEAPTLPGRFDVAKAKALKVPHGPMFSQLQKGNNITLEDGTVVKPSQVLGPPRTGAPVVMVDCPSLDLLPSLVSNPAWERLYRNDENDRNISNTSSSSSGSSGAAGSGKKKRGGGGGVAFDDAPFVVHMASAEVLRSAEYARWARRFGPRAKHLVTTQPFCSPHSIFQAAHDQAVKLNRVCGPAFPLPQQFVTGVPWDEAAAGNHGGGAEGADSGGYDVAGRDGGEGVGQEETRGIIPPEVRLIGPDELDFGGKVMAAIPLLKFEMLPTAKRPQMDTSEALTWERSREATLSSLRRLEELRSCSPSRSHSSRSSSRSPSRSPARFSERSPARSPVRSASRSPPRSPSSRSSSGRNSPWKAPAPFVTPAGAARSDVSFLGTGSAMPSKYRNVTGMLVRLSPTGACDPPSFPPVGSAAARGGASGGGEMRVPGGPGMEARSLGSVDGGGGNDASAAAAAAAGTFGGGSILLDAGEGSFGQLWRMFGESSSSHAKSSSSGGGDDATADGGINTRAQQMLRDLSAVWISHPHADHHLGLVRILSERNKLLRGGGGGAVAARTGGLGGSLGGAGAAAGTGANVPNLLLMAPAPVADWLKEYGNIDPTVRGGYDFLDASLMQAGEYAPRPTPHVAAAAARALARAGILRATSVRVTHCAHAYGLVLTVASTAAKAAAAVAANVFTATAASRGAGARGGTGGTAGGWNARAAEGLGGDGDGEDWKLVYSGDCRPSEALVRAGKGAAVLIHEATFDETMQQEAYDKMHCTMPEALKVGKRMGAERVILTHFSQRYPHMPSSLTGGLGTNVCLAFDNMRVRIADLTWLPRSYGDIKTVVTPDAEELQQQKRERHTSGSADTSGGGWGERVPRHDLSSARQRNMTSHT